VRKDCGIAATIPAASTMGMMQAQRVEAIVPPGAANIMRERQPEEA